MQLARLRGHRLYRFGRSSSVCPQRSAHISVHVLCQPARPLFGMPRGGAADDGGEAARARRKPWQPGRHSECGGSLEIEIPDPSDVMLDVLHFIYTGSLSRGRYRSYEGPAGRGWVRVRAPTRTRTRTRAWTPAPAPAPAPALAQPPAIATIQTPVFPTQIVSPDALLQRSVISFRVCSYSANRALRSRMRWWCRIGGRS